MLVPQSPFPSPLTKKLSQLDEEMKAILDNNELSEASKALLYSNTLNKYLDVKRQMEAPRRIPIVDETQQPQLNPQSAPMGTDPITDYIPSQFRNRAKNLLSHLRDHSEASWNERNELVIDDKPVVGSNMVDLIDDVVRVKRGHSPAGATAFRRVLLESNVPLSLIGNKTRWTELGTSFETPPTTPKRLSPLNETIRRLDTPITPKAIAKKKKKGQTGKGACRKRKAVRKTKWESL